MVRQFHETIFACCLKTEIQGESNEQEFLLYRELFSNMYNCIYKNMVKAGVAIRIDQEIMYKKTGAMTSYRSKMVGRSTKYILTKPERVVLVDETGCNTNLQIRRLSW